MLGWPWREGLLTFTQVAPRLCLKQYMQGAPGLDLSNSHFNRKLVWRV